MVAKVAALVLNRASIAVIGQLIHAGRHIMPKRVDKTFVDVIGIGQSEIAVLGCWFRDFIVIFREWTLQKSSKEISLHLVVR